MKFIYKARNLFIHIKRLVGWIVMLSFTLLKFLIKNPQETPAILAFILQKSMASPKFLSRNVIIEKHYQKYQTVLLQTVKLYTKYCHSFNPRNPDSYIKLNKILSDKTQILYFLVRKIKPRIIVETGVAAGQSSGYILQAIKDNGFGKLYSIDLPFQWYIYGMHKLHLDSLPSGKTSGYLVPKKLKRNWRLILGNSHDKLPKLLKKLNKIDLFFHDSEHTDKTMSFEYNTSWAYINKRGVLMSDDINFTKTFHNFLQEKKGKKFTFKNIGIFFKK